MFKTLPGFREFYPEDVAKRDYIFKVWRDTARAFAFREFDPPVLEQLDLFTEKSGEEIKSQLFEFTDKGGRAVSMRPEMTPSLARMVGAKANSIRRPVKWFCMGENYRYERQQKGRLRAFYQFNADILGEESLRADAEIIGLLVGILKAFGLTQDEFKVRLGDRTLWVLFLENAGVKDELIMPVLSVVDKIERVSPEAFLEMLEEALAGSQIDAGVLADKIRAFIPLKDLDSFGAAFEGGMIPQDRIEGRLTQWRELFASLKDMGVADFVKPDLGIVRGLAYYTGFVFEAFQTVGTGRALAGGGRYDNLVKKLGYPDMPAVGFGMGDVTVSDLLELVGKGKSIDSSPDVCVVIADDSLRGEALKAIYALRGDGISVDYQFKTNNMGKQLKYADSIGARLAVIFAPDEFSAGCVSVKNLKDGSSLRVELNSLVCSVEKMLSVGK